MEKCNFLKILQCPDFENLWGDSWHLFQPKKLDESDGGFCFLRIIFSSHVIYRVCHSCLLFCLFSAASSSVAGCSAGSLMQETCAAVSPDLRCATQNPISTYLINIQCWLIWATDTEISVKNGVWGPVEWVGDQLTGWGGSSQKQNSKINGLCFLNFLIWATFTFSSI